MKCYCFEKSASGLILGKKENSGHNVGFLLPNSNAACATFFAFQLYHKVAVMLNFSAGLSSILQSCKLAAIKKIVTSRKFIKLANLESTINALINYCRNCLFGRSSSKN